MIPSMRFVIHTFGGCEPALKWAADMDVQKGWEVCVEPGWLMLLAFNTQNHVHAVGFDKAVECEYACIEPCLKHIRDDLILEALEKARKNPKGDLQEEITHVQALMKITFDKIKREVSNQSFKTAYMPEYFAINSVLYFLKAMDAHADPKISAKWANSAVDSCVNSLLAEKYPDFVGRSFGICPFSPPEEMEAYKLKKKIEICNILRKIIPQPYTTYEE